MPRFWATNPWMAGLRLAGDVGGRFADYRELLSHGAADEFRCLETRIIQSCHKAGNVAGCLDDIAQVEFFTPHILAGPREGRSPE